MRKKIFVSVGVAMLALFATPYVVRAHVTVSPKEVGVGKFQTFNLSVPVEKEIATTGLRLVMPEGLEHVSPTVKPGWKIDIKHGEAMSDGDAEHTGHAEHGPVVEVSWTGGSIPMGQRDDFSFSAKVPSEPTTLSWKAYQTYADGTVVAWELGPNDQQPQKDGKPDFSSKGPASETKIVDDLADTSAATTTSTPAETSKSGKTNADIALVVSVVALVVSILFGMRKRTA